MAAIHVSAADTKHGVVKRCAKCGKPTKKRGRARCKRCNSTNFVQRISTPNFDIGVGIAKRCAKCGRSTKKMERTRCKTCKSNNFIQSQSIGEAFYCQALFNKEAITDTKQSEVKASRRISLSSTDEFGFSSKSGEIRTDESKHLDSSTLQKRIIKWNKMCSGSLLHHRKFKERLEKGVPTPMRGVIWYKMVGEPALKEAETKLPPLHTADGVADTHFEHFVRYAQMHPNEFTRKGGLIDRDLDRTFPNSVQFSTIGGEGQTRLKKVLSAYAGYNPEFGYAQGMNFIVAMLLGFMPEKEAFWVLVGLMDRKPFQLNLMFKKSMPLAHTWFYCMEQLLKKRLPSIYIKFKEFGFSPVMYMAEWIFSLFSKTCPKSLVARVWDVFFMEGWAVIFSTALAIIYKKRKAIQQTTEAADLMNLIRTWTATLNGDKIRNYSHMAKLKVTAKQLNALRQEHEKAHPSASSTADRNHSTAASTSACSKASKTGGRNHSTAVRTSPRAAPAENSSYTLVASPSAASYNSSDDDDSPYV